MELKEKGIQLISQRSSKPNWKENEPWLLEDLALLMECMTSETNAPLGHNSRS